MDRALLCDFEQLRSLLVCKRACELEFSLYTIENAFFRFTFRAVLGVNLRMSKTDDDSFEWPIPPPCVHSHRHGGTSSQSREEKIVGRRTTVRAARSDRLIGVKMVRSRNNILRISRSSGANDHAWLRDRRMFRNFLRFLHLASRCSGSPIRRPIYSGVSPIAFVISSCA
jgi:hypothetical protein